MQLKRNATKANASARRRTYCGAQLSQMECENMYEIPYLIICAFCSHCRALNWRMESEARERSRDIRRGLNGIISGKRIICCIRGVDKSQHCTSLPEQNEQHFRRFRVLSLRLFTTFNLTVKRLTFSLLIMHSYFGTHFHSARNSIWILWGMCVCTWSLSCSSYLVITRKWLTSRDGDASTHSF